MAIRLKHLTVHNRTSLYFNYFAKQSFYYGVLTFIAVDQGHYVGNMGFKAFLITVTFQITQN